ncbi:MAG TPA: helix-turn-helix transcriptional regulator [Alphaproteobacteria bacterium]
MAGLQKRFAANVRRVRLDRRWTQEELAFRAHVHQTYLSGIENRIRNPSLAVIERLADALGVEADELLRKVPRSAR